ncbi:MAG: GNAT family N-acetyltransferase, partial [Nitrososphaerota archaeon]
GEAVGSVGYWENSWHGEDIYEIGWLVLTAFQGRGIASAATTQAIGRPGPMGSIGFCTPSRPSRMGLPTGSAGSWGSRWWRRSSPSIPKAI